MEKLFPETALTVDGRAYRLVFDVRAQMLVEAKASTPTDRVSFQAVVESAMKGMRTAARLLFWGSLQRHHSDITVDQAGDLMGTSEVAAWSAMREAMHETVPDARDVEELGIGRKRSEGSISDQWDWRELEIESRRLGLSRDECPRLTVRGLYREFVVMKKRREDRLELATFQAYQTVRVYVMTRAKGRMPNFRSLLNGSAENTIDARTSPQKSEAMLDMLAARAGTKVKPIDHTRIVRGL